jgi:thiamine biosynthesis lipoprotein
MRGGHNAQNRLRAILAGALMIASMCPLGDHGARADDRAWLAQARYVMGTILEIRLPAGSGSQSLLGELFGIARRCDEIFSTFKPESPVSQFNRQARRGEAFPAPREMIELTLTSQSLSDQTEGAFDITVGPLVRLWKESARANRRPRTDQLASARDRVGARKIAVDAEAMTVIPRVEGIELDFNAIAKGYCVDQMVEVVRAGGITRAFINLGESSIYALGKGPDDRPWRVFVRDPGRPSSTRLALRLSDMAIGSSGSYENSLRAGGRRINHIIDPRSGMPASSDVAATVIAPSATVADALSTAMIVLGPREGLRVLERFPGAEAVIFYRSRKGRWEQVFSSGMKRFVEEIASHQAAQAGRLRPTHLHRRWQR